MFENDYLMRMIMQLATVLRKMLLEHPNDPLETAEDIERAIGNAVDIDPDLLFSFDPDSMVSMLQLGNFDEHLSGYVLRSMYYEASILEQAGQTQRADLRRAQADAVAKAYGVEISPEDLSEQALVGYFSEEEPAELSDAGLPDTMEVAESLNSNLAGGTLDLK
ncbi:MAG: hypothetical protein LBR39_07465 [Coriobacteriales bacterium]|jgi:hypothetical protein|nr:hypothetical protein [Coriobacteriales bacterium]